MTVDDGGANTRTRVCGGPPQRSIRHAIWLAERCPRVRAAYVFWPFLVISSSRVIDVTRRLARDKLYSSRGTDLRV